MRRHPAESCRIEKANHPERFCAVRYCLWRVRHADGSWKSECKRHPRPVEDLDLPMVDPAFKSLEPVT